MSRRLPLATAFAVNAGLLALAIGALWSFNAVIDPYNANRWVELGVDKKPVVARLSYYDHVLPRYAFEPAPVVLIGDSRAHMLDEAALSAAAGRPVINLAAGGARWREVLAVADFVMDTRPPQTLLLQLNVDMLNGSARLDRVSGARRRLEHPLENYLHPGTTRASARILWHLWTGEGGVDEKPPMDREAFWQFQLDAVPRIPYANWSWPEAAMTELSELQARCEAEGTELVVLMLPTHQDLRDRMAELGLDDENTRLREAIRARVPRVIDLDRTSPFTTDDALWSDPYHPHKDHVGPVIDDLFGRR